MNKIVGSLILLGLEKNNESDHIEIPFEIEVSKQVVSFSKSYPLEDTIWYIKNLKIVENE